jgi:uncharacterized membrane protein YeaQ/YmgE (transglycosylase-associated protein family)
VIILALGLPQAFLSIDQGHLVDNSVTAAGYVSLVGPSCTSMLPLMLILGLILFGMLVGAGAQLILGKSAKGVDWTLALVAGLVGSFVGGLLASLLSGDGLRFRPSGIIGSLVGALLVTAGWQWYRRRSKAPHA